VIETIHVSDETFDNALAKFGFIDETLVPIAELRRALERDEKLDRYVFTGLCEALRSEEFEEDPLETVQDLELEQVFATDEDAWDAIKEFYADRACLVLRVGDTEEFIVGREIALRLGLI
jgi:hypothetical protein